MQILTVVNDLLSQRGLLLKTGPVVDATLIPAPISTKNKDKARDPEMHSSKKGNQWHMTAGHPYGWGMKAHIGADALIDQAEAQSGDSGQSGAPVSGHQVSGLRASADGARFHPASLMLAGGFFAFRQRNAIN